MARCYITSKKHDLESLKKFEHAIKNMFPDADHLSICPDNNGNERLWFSSSYFDFDLGIWPTLSTTIYYQKEGEEIGSYQKFQYSIGTRLPLFEHIS